MPVEMAFLLAAVGFAFWGALLAWRWKSARDFAPSVYAAKREQGELEPHVDETAFAAHYVSAEGPRAATYMFSTALACTVSIPPLMGVFSAVWHQVWMWTGQWEPVARGMMVHIFALFLFSMVIMIAVLAFAMRRYHMKAPPSLKKAIDHLNTQGNPA